MQSAKYKTLHLALCTLDLNSWAHLNYWNHLKQNYFNDLPPHILPVFQFISRIIYYLDRVYLVLFYPP